MPTQDLLVPPPPPSPFQSFFTLQTVPRPVTPLDPLPLFYRFLCARFLFSGTVTLSYSFLPFNFSLTTSPPWSVPLTQPIHPHRPPTPLPPPPPFYLIVNRAYEPKLRHPHIFFQSAIKDDAVEFFKMPKC